MPLNDPAIRNAKADTKPMKLFDSGGLFLLVTCCGCGIGFTWIGGSAGTMVIH
jgi:hypothetical protein